MATQQQIEAAKKALEELANSPMNIPLKDWCRISETILAALTAAEAVAEPVKVKPLEWREGTYESTDDDNGPMEGIAVTLKAWRSNGYLIIKQRGEDGLFILRGRCPDVDCAAPTLEAATAVAQADHERRILSAIEEAL